MRMLLIGGGGREHALGLKFTQDDPLLELHSAPGNPGLAALGPCHDVAVDDLEGLVNLCRRMAPDWVIIGPEVPLTLGLVDRLKAQGAAVFGPSQAAAQLEASKSFAKEIMAAANVPTAAYARFETAEAALKALPDWPPAVVVKVDGLAAGKGVVVCEDQAQAIAAIAALKAYGQPLILEEVLHGTEISLFAVVNARAVTPLTTAQDHKRVGEGDTGANTGGMGAYSPAPLPAGLTTESLCDLTVRPIADAMAAQGMAFYGVLFVGLMLTDDGPKVLEYNVRFGDPEGQVLLARLQSDLLAVLTQQSAPKWHAGAAMSVVLAAQGYPGAYATGQPITAPKSAHLLHAGTKLVDGQLVTNGGRVMNAVGTGDTLAEARAAAYGLAEQVSYEGRFYRKDIGWRAL